MGDPVAGGRQETKSVPQEAPAISQLASEDSLELHFDDQRLFSDLLGQHDAHVRTVESALGVRIGVTGTSLKISGAHAEQALAGKVISELYDLLKHGHPIYPSDVEYAIRIIRGDRNAGYLVTGLAAGYTLPKQDVELLQTIATEMALMIENADLRKKTELQSHRLDQAIIALEKISQALTAVRRRPGSDVDRGQTSSRISRR